MIIRRKYVENVKSSEAEDLLSLETSPTQRWDRSDWYLWDRSRLGEQTLWHSAEETDSASASVKLVLVPLQHRGRGCSWTASGKAAKVWQIILWLYDSVEMVANGNLPLCKVSSPSTGGPQTVQNSGNLLFWRARISVITTGRNSAPWGNN